MVFVICPVMNEIQTILNTVEKLGKSELELNVIFVDGHSDDGTFELLQKKCREYSGFLVTRQSDMSTGKGGAIKEGIDLAKNRWNNGIIVLMDSDIESLKSDWIKKLVEPIREGGADVVKASYDYKGRDLVTDKIAKPLMRSLFPEVCFERPIEGEVAFTSDVLDNIKLSDGFAIESHFTIDVSVNDYECIEVSLGKKVHEPRTGKSLAKLAKEVQSAILEKGLEYNRL